MKNIHLETIVIGTFSLDTEPQKISITFNLFNFYFNIATELSDSSSS